MGAFYPPAALLSTILVSCHAPALLFCSASHMSWRVLITARVFNVVGKPALQLLRDNGCEVVISDPTGPLKIHDLLPRIDGFDATLCSPDQYNAAALQSPAAQRLKIISRWG